MEPATSERRPVPIIPWPERPCVEAIRRERQDGARHLEPQELDAGDEAALVSRSGVESKQGWSRHGRIEIETSRIAEDRPAKGVAGQEAAGAKILRSLFKPCCECFLRRII